VIKPMFRGEQRLSSRQAAKAPGTRNYKFMETSAPMTIHRIETFKKLCAYRVCQWNPSLEDSIRLVKNSKLYKEFLAERQEILCHKWIESEKVGYDIGFERALFDWIVKYRSAWLDERRRLLASLANVEHTSDLVVGMPAATTGYR
jgi:hypothetical protein